MDLIHLSRDKGFISRDKLIEVNKEYYYLWMCELQKWLREKHQINIRIHIGSLNDYEPYIETFNSGEETNILFDPFKNDHKGISYTYEEALEVALFIALKLIK